MDGKQFLIPLWYNLECTIHTPGFRGCQQSNVIGVEKIRICFDALCVNRNAFPDFVPVNSGAGTRS
ncbi:hypothetical protein T10_3115 [Trichinella papuae]|uniref:Uncharacterized protein n=1 Tax=Trichinella papuae TaxID=268474 RepID=A0A0V1M532_9BILA|nr:hypothetical protein T10_3115 [Trichinella papuae]